MGAGQGRDCTKNEGWAVEAEGCPGNCGWEDGNFRSVNSMIFSTVDEVVYVRW